MRLFGRIGLAALVTLVPGAAVTAADAIIVPVASSPVGVPVVESAAFDWNGFYAGVYGVGQTSLSRDAQYGVGINAGVNAQFDFFLIGAEVALQGLTGEALDTTYGQVLGKAGLLITENVLVYTAAGYGFGLGAPVEDDVLLGGGVELAVTDDFTVRAQYLHGFAITGGNPKEQVTLGANFHF